MILLNDALPPEFQMAYGGRRDSTVASFGEIVVSLESPFSISFNCGITAVACATKGWNRALVRIPDDMDTSEFIYPRSVIVHELLHALGIIGHVDSIEFPDSIMGTAGEHIPNGRNIISKIGREVLQIMYMSQSSDVYNDWSEWADVSFHLMGQSEDEDMQFGVALFNGLPQPWARGTYPDTSLEDNPRLSGTATWEGTMVGFSGPSPLLGDAELEVNIATLSDDESEHDLRFRDIFYVNRFESADLSASSSRWFSTRNIDYKVSISGNIFDTAVAEGYENGWVDGAFMGENHEHMAGTVKRTDMIGAFGDSSTTSDNQVVEPPPPPSPTEVVSTSQSTERGTTAADLIDYLKDMAGGGPWGPPGNTWQRWPQLPLWAGPPTVRIRTDAKPEYHRMTAKAVDLINDWLPVEHRMVMGTRNSLWTGDPADVPAGEIHVTFNSPDAGAQSRYNESGSQYRTDDVPRMVSTLVAINDHDIIVNTEHELYGIVVHELVHAMGLPGHVFEGRHPTSLLPDSAYRDGGLPDEAGLPELPRLDGEALMTAYSVFDNGEIPAEINYTSLGAWATTIPTISGELSTTGGDVSFGAEHRTQWTRAWNEGPVPATSLAASTLTGTATWTGAMVGYTDAGTAVEGDAGITVDILDMDGTAAFTDLMAGDSSWGPDLSTAIGDRQLLRRHGERTAPRRAGTVPGLRPRGRDRRAPVRAGPRGLDRDRDLISGIF